MATIPYWQQLKDPRWQQKRLKIMERDNWMCRECKSKDTTLNVHHKFYEKGLMAWEYKDIYLVTLCDRCHRTTEELLQAVKIATGVLNQKSLERVLGAIYGVMMKIDPKFEFPTTNSPRIARGISEVVHVDESKFIERLVGRGSYVRLCDVTSEPTQWSGSEVASSG